MTLFRLFYLCAVVVGLFTNYREYVSARDVYRALIKLRINGSRQQLARYFVREEFIRVYIQTSLLIPATIGLYYSIVGIPPVPPGPYLKLIVISQLAHIMAAMLLAVKAVIVRNDRLAIMNVLRTEEAKRHHANS